MSEGDWLFGISGKCGEGDDPWDNDILSRPSKFFLPILFLASALLLVLLPKLSPLLKLALAEKSASSKAVESKKTQNVLPEPHPAENEISPDFIDLECQSASQASAGPREGDYSSSDRSSREEGRSPEGFLQGSSLDTPSMESHVSGEQEPTKNKSGKGHAAAPKERLVYIDFTRILCVACVVTEHSGGAIYSHVNALFVLQWVMPFLFLVSGLCYSMSHVPLWMYILRLTPVFLAGTGFNWIADIIAERDWQGNFMNTIFQMMYVVSLMVFATFMEPLKLAVVHQKKNPTARPSKIAIIGAILSGVVATACFVALFLSKEMDKEEVAKLNRQEVFFETAAAYGIVGIVTARMALVFVSTMIQGSNGVAFWLAIATTYLPAIVAPYPNAGAYHSTDLFMLGVLAAKWKLPGQQFIRKCWQSYWPFVLAILLILSTPRIDGRCDLDPFNSAWVRTRFFAIEVILITGFISKAFVAEDPWNLTGILNVWALFAYVTHVAWDRLLPRPGGPLVTYGFLVAVLVVKGIRYLMGRQETIRI